MAVSKTHKQACARMSTNLPFPSSPHWAPRTTPGPWQETPTVRMVPISHQPKHCSNLAKDQNGESEPSTSDGLRGPIRPAKSPAVAGSWSIHTNPLNISNVVNIVRCHACQTTKAARPAGNMNAAAAELASRTLESEGEGSK